MREKQYLLTLIILFVLAGCGINEEDIQNGTESNSAKETSTEKSNSEEQSGLDNTQNDQEQQSENQENNIPEKVVTSANQAIDLVFENVIAGGGLKLNDRSNSTAEELSDGYLVHINSEDGTSEMGRYKVFFNGKIIPGIVLTSSDAKQKVIETIKITDENFTQEKYNFLITPISDYKFVVTVNLNDSDGATEQEKNNQGDYTIGPDGVVTNHDNLLK